MNFDRLKNEIKEKADLIELVENSGVHLKKNGRAYMGLCPFHEDKNPSLAVYPETGTWHCFGCNKGGDVFDWVMEYEQIDYKQAFKKLVQDSGIQAVSELKSKPTKSAEDKNRRERRFEIYRLASRAYAANLQRYPAVLKYLIQKRGLTKQSIRQHGLGFCDGKDPLFQDLQKQGFSLQELTESGLFYENGRQVFSGYITFPNILNKNVVYITARKYTPANDAGMDPTQQETKKYLKPIGVKTEFLFNEEMAKNKEVYLCEGEIDALTLLQNGYPACGLYGVSSFKAGWEKKLTRAQKAWITFDTEQNQAGIRAAVKIARQIGRKAKIIRLPASSANKMDINDFFLQFGSDELEIIRQKASGWAETWADLIVENPADEETLIDEVTALFQAMKGESKIRQDRIIEYLHRKLKLQKRTLRGLLTDSEHAYPSNNENIDDIPRKILVLSQDYQNGILYYTLPKDNFRIVRDKNGRGKVVHDRIPLIISSTREKIEVTDYEELLLQHHIVPAAEPYFLKQERWKKIHYEEFLNGFTPDPMAVYLSVWLLYEKYIDMAEGESAILALFTIGTYFYKIFDAYPYILLNGEKGSGKSKTLLVAEKLCFNPVLSANFSLSGIFRLVERGSCTLLMDEVEGLQGNDKYEEIKGLLNAGYKKGGTAMRVEGENFDPVEYEVFSPKIFANIRGLGEVLRTRCIEFTMLRTTDPEKANNAVMENSERWGEVRHLLYSFALSYAPEIEKIAQERTVLAGELNLQGRPFEKWLPIAAMAKFFEQHGIEELYTKIRALAAQKEASSSQEELDDWTVTLFMILERKSRGNPFMAISNKELSSEMQAVFGEKHAPSTKWIGRCLKRFGLKHGQRKNAGIVYTMRRQAILEIMKRYHMPKEEENKESPP